MSENPTDPKGAEAVKLLLYGACNAFFDAWMLMLFLGVAHANAHVIPTLGYWQSFFGAYVFVCFSGSAIMPLTERLKKLAKLI